MTKMTNMNTQVQQHFPKSIDRLIENYEILRVNSGFKYLTRRFQWVKYLGCYSLELRFNLSHERYLNWNFLFFSFELWSLKNTKDELMYFQVLIPITVIYSFIFLTGVAGNLCVCLGNPFYNSIHFLIQK